MSTFILMALLGVGPCPPSELVRTDETVYVEMQAAPACQSMAPRRGMRFVTTLVGAYRSWEDADWWQCVVHTERELVSAPMVRFEPDRGHAVYTVTLSPRQVGALRLERADKVHLVCRLLGEPDPRYAFSWTLKKDKGKVRWTK